jgi:GNAT superfamily N-acetyltransferase
MMNTEQVYALYLDCFPDYAAGFDVFLNHTGLDDGKTHIINETDKGFALVRDNAIMLLCVKESDRGQGVGSKLLKAAEKEIFAHFSEVVLGNTPSHYLYPGAPIAAKTFFEKRGYTVDWECYDMMIDMNDGVWRDAPCYDGDEFVFKTASAENAEALRAFGETIYEVWGGIYAASEKVIIAVEKKSGRIVGAITVDDFCPMNASFPEAGGFGCVGISEDFRRHGLGMRICAEAIKELTAMGKNRCFIGYLVLTKWYGKLGAKIIARYAMGGKKINQ